MENSPSFHSRHLLNGLNMNMPQHHVCNSDPRWQLDKIISLSKDQPQVILEILIMDLEFACRHIASHQTTTTKKRMQVENDFCFYASPFYASHHFNTTWNLRSDCLCRLSAANWEGERKKSRKTSKPWRGSEGCGQKSKQQPAESSLFVASLLLPPVANSPLLENINSQSPWAANQNERL